MRRKLKKPKDNLKLIISNSERARESKFEQDRRAELTLLSLLCECTTVEEKIALCGDLGVDQDEVLLLEDKWKHLIRRYEKERNQSRGNAIANIIDQQLREE